MSAAPCTPENPCLHWFPNEGFRPAIWATDEIGPWCPLLIKADDSPYAGKAPVAPFDPYGHVPVSDIITPALLATPTESNASTPRITEPGFPGWPGFPSWPGKPGVIDPAPPPGPMPSPVPLPAGGLLLISALVAFAAVRRWR